MNKHLITISILCSLAFSAQAGQDFYKWVDERGVTHYSQSPPEGMTKDSKVQTVNVRTRIPVDADQAIADLERKRADSAKDREGASKVESGKQKTQQADARQREQNKANCEQWKKDIETLQKPNIREDDGSGNVRVMTEEDKQKRLEQTQKYIQEYCSQ